MELSTPLTVVVTSAWVSLINIVAGWVVVMRSVTWQFVEYLAFNEGTPFKIFVQVMRQVELQSSLSSSSCPAVGLPCLTRAAYMVPALLI